ncbi:urease accessory protein UreD [Sinisalibacter aestuarii]|uniref:Urease accessory protein UreD n=1 Tax=Sinisalibacter aestuarii TaxID=2949426 RepID=A0ABQ5LY29_9RHOB|nr:urease accessory protein UreD [Sinisalibacter aestuarii]GKY89156.1 urease accessory protein UreD [Sinisalibacter aestuarii]
MNQPAATIATSLEQPRARGQVRLTLKPGPGGGAIDGLRMSGSLKLMFPRPGGGAFEAVLVNTAGGVTGGDRFATEAVAGPGTALSLTTQAAERAYRAAGPEPGRIATRLMAGPGARLGWLPQETILYDGAHLSRRLQIDMAADARVLMVEPVVFGRAAMGEELRDARFHDRVEIRRAGALVWRDAVALAGDIAAQMDRAALGRGARAMASLVYAAPDADAHLDRLRALLPETAGASLVRAGLLAARILAPDSYTLRQSLVPALRLLNQDEIPRPWML